MSDWNLVSWNVNGIRAAWKKGFTDWLASANPTVLGLQETKIQGDQLTPEMTELDGYNSYWSHPTTKKGYSGVAIYSQHTPDAVSEGIGVDAFDQEGRVLRADYADFTFFTIYFPNGQRDDERLQYKLGFYDAFLEMTDKLVDEGRHVVFCGDVNTAHKPIDLARPKENETVSGFLPIERAWLDKVVERGYIDTFRELHPDAVDRYSWWNMRTRARERNVGWRIDYFFISPGLRKHLVGADIHDDVLGSDHCPVSIQLQF
jgi:exodeoxyribonuclease III